MSFADRREADSYARSLRVLEVCAASLESNPEVALHVIAAGARELCDVSRAAGEAGGSQTLDELCLAFGRNRSCVSPTATHHERKKRERIVYIVSELYMDGGHTRVLEDVVRSLPAFEHVVVWLSWERPLQQDDYAPILRLDPLPEIFRVRGALEVCLADGVRVLNELEPNVLMLLGHPYDPVSVALMGHRSGCKRFVLHHADQGFSLGRFVPGATHVSGTRRFTALATERWDTTTQLIPVMSSDPYDVTSRVPSTAFTTASCAAAHKFDLDGDPSYLDVLRERFTRREGKHVHFGTFSQTQLRRIESVLDELDARERFTQIPFVESLAVGLLQNGVDLYIDSVPIAGSKALVEAMAAGVATCFTAHDASFDGSAFSFDGAFSWRTAAELGAYLADAHDETIETAGRLARKQYEREHSPEVFASRLRLLLSGAQADE